MLATIIVQSGSLSLWWMVALLGMGVLLSAVPVRVQRLALATSVAASLAWLAFVIIRCDWWICCVGIFCA